MHPIVLRIEPGALDFVNKSVAGTTHILPLFSLRFTDCFSLQPPGVLHKKSFWLLAEHLWELMPQQVVQPSWAKVVGYRRRLGDIYLTVLPLQWEGLDVCSM